MVEAIMVVAEVAVVPVRWLRGHSDLWFKGLYCLTRLRD